MVTGSRLPERIIILIQLTGSTAIHGMQELFWKRLHVKPQEVSFYKCTGCDATKTEKIPAKSHTIVKDNAIKATVFKAGKTEGKHCKVCVL